MKGSSTAPWVAEDGVLCLPQAGFNCLSLSFLCDGFSATSSWLPVSSSWISCLHCVGKFFFSFFLFFLFSSHSGEAQVDKEDTRTQKVGYSQGQRSRPVNFYGVRSLGHCQTVGSLVTITAFDSGTAPGSVQFPQREPRPIPCPKELTWSGGERQISRWL